MGQTPTEVATFPAAYPEFGDLVVHDDGHEATVVLGTLMHTHIDARDSPGAEPGTERAVVEKVLDFLGDVFADRLVVWCVPGKSGGYFYAGGTADHVPPDAKVFVWSGPRTAARPA